MRRLWLLVPVALAAVVSLTASAAAKPPDPCLLITTAEASTVFGKDPRKPKTVEAGVYRSCTYAIKRKKMTVLTRRVPTRAAFDKSAKANRGIVLPVQGVGAPTYSVNGTKLLVWHNGTEVTITFAGVQPFVAVQQALAKTAAGRL